LYDWTWDPPTGLSTTTGPVTDAFPITTTTYTVTGISTTGCTTETISKDIVVALTDGPIAAYDDPGSQCGFFDITTLVWYDAAGVPGTVSGFYTVIPDSADQPGPLFTGPLMDETDIVYLMIGDTSTGCFSVIEIELTWGGSGQAGNDSTETVCNNGSNIDLDDYLSPGAASGGIWSETTSSGQFNTSTAVFDPTDLPAGNYTFEYLVPGLSPCPDDIAEFTITVLAAPDADFHYEILGESSDDGLNSGCLINDVDFFDESTIGAGGVLDEWDWDFGDATGSTATDPSHNYSGAGPGTYTITLIVTATNGCTDSYDMDITMYETPVLDLIFNDPNCYGFTDGSVSVNTSGGSGSFDIEITNSVGTILNVGGSNAANSLGEGWYYINVDDGSGCSGIDSVFLDDPEPLVVDLTLIMPACYGDQTGMAIVDTVLNVVGSNNTLSYFWNPNPGGENGEFADTSIMLGAGDYTLTVNTESGCTQVVNFTITEPEELVFAELGVEPAYCRLFPFQSGNGVVFAAATGGTPDYGYEWCGPLPATNPEYDCTDNTTWGGLNPGDYQITVTDDNGCVLTQVITLDSLNPIAAFTPFGDGLDMSGEFCHGLVPIDVSFSNESENFSNPNDPLADTTFFWHFGYNGELWQINHDYSAILDTSYTEKGTYTVCLVAQNKNGCTDTACTDLILCDPLIFKPVNVFTPDGDGINDIFTFQYLAQAVKDFHAVILDRWGVKMAEINSITEGWNGTDKGGSTVPDGVYFYYYEGNAEDGAPFSGQGNVQVLKGGK
jgi:gliding motility-associated-like protein